MTSNTYTIKFTTSVVVQQITAPNIIVCTVSKWWKGFDLQYSRDRKTETKSMSILFFQHCLHDVSNLGIANVAFIFVLWFLVCLACDRSVYPTTNQFQLVQVFGYMRLQVNEKVQPFLSTIFLPASIWCKTSQSLWSLFCLFWSLRLERAGTMGRSCQFSVLLSGIVSWIQSGPL